MGQACTTQRKDDAVEVESKPKHQVYSTSSTTSGRKVRTPLHTKPIGELGDLPPMVLDITRISKKARETIESARAATTSEPGSARSP